MHPCPSQLRKHSPNVWRPALLLQTEKWVDVHGCERDPRKIDLAYARNLLAYLQRRLTPYETRTLALAEYESVSAALAQPHGDMAELAIEHEADEILRAMYLPPAAFVLRTPLGMLLQSRIEGDEDA